MKPPLLLLFALIVIHINAQTGIYAWTSINNAQKAHNIHQYKLNGYQGIRMIVPWYVIQPTERNLSFAFLKAAIKEVSDSGLNIELHIWAGPDAPIFGDYHWLAEKGVESFTTAGGSDDGPWPNYYNPVYKDAFNKLHSALADTLHNLPPDQKLHLKSVFISSANTADLQAFKGVPVGTTYGVNNDEVWQQYYRMQWETAYGFYQQNSSFMHVTLNAGNLADNLQWIFDNAPDAYIKHGDRSHEYPLAGETYVLNWPRKLYLGEVDASLKESRWPADHFQLIRSALSTFTSRLDFFDEWKDYRDMPVITAFFNKYVSQFDPVTANKGFCALAEKISFEDTNTYNRLDFGLLYSDLRAYSKAIDKINALNTDSFYKQMKIVNTSMNYGNPARLYQLIRTGAGYAPEGPYYVNDISFYTNENYSLNVRQLLINQTSTDARSFDASLDPEQSVYGRNGRKPKTYQGKKALYFRVDDNLITTKNKDTVTITVTYKDAGDALWQIQCSDQVKSIQNSNTGAWKQAVLAVNHFQRGGQMQNNSDVILQILTGNPFPFDMIEVYNQSKDCMCGQFTDSNLHQPLETISKKILFVSGSLK